MTGSAAPAEIPDDGPQEGWGLMGKVFLFGVVIALFAAYMRFSKPGPARNGGILGEDKSLA